VIVGRCPLSDVLITIEGPREVFKVRGAVLIIVGVAFAFGLIGSLMTVVGHHSAQAQPNMSLPGFQVMSDAEDEQLRRKRLVATHEILPATK